MCRLRRLARLWANHETDADRETAEDAQARIRGIHPRRDRRREDLRVDRIRDGGSQVRLRLRQGSGDAAEPNGLEAHFRREDDLARSLDWELGLPLPIALLGHERPGDMGGGLVAGARRCQPRTGSPRERQVLWHRQRAGTDGASAGNAGNRSLMVEEAAALVGLTR